MMPSVRRGPWSIADSYDFIASFLNKSGRGTPRYTASLVHYPETSRKGHTRGSRLQSHTYYVQTRRYAITHTTERKSSVSHSCSYKTSGNLRGKRHFHDYFVTHLPSSSLHPDSGGGPRHKLPRSASTPHKPSSSPNSSAPAALLGASRELTVVRIPLRSAKHHFGVSVSRGSRPYNEDTYQAGTLEIPAFAKRAPISLSRSSSGGAKNGSSGNANGGDGNVGAENKGGDPQVFYFGVFDGHGGNECSDFLREELHGYVERTAGLFELGSSLKKRKKQSAEAFRSEQASSGEVKMKSEEEVQEDMNVPVPDENGEIHEAKEQPVPEGDKAESVESNKPKTIELEESLVAQWKETVGGYFRRFKPDFFNTSSASSDASSQAAASSPDISIETVLMYAFLQADLDFITAQAAKPDKDNHHSDKPLNADDILGSPAHSSHRHRIGGPTRFIGGSTASVALISTPTPTPFWHPASPSTIVVAHVGDTRILLCSTATGLAKPLTTNHHPSSPVEGSRLRRYAATFVTDSFGEERMSGLANTRAFGDMRSKRIGVSAEPELLRLELAPAEYSFLVLVSDGVSGVLSDQEVVDVVKEARTPEQGARDVVSFATEVGGSGAGAGGSGGAGGGNGGDNATCLVVRLGGWERRSEGGMGSLGTKEVRDFRRAEAGDPRRGRT